MAAMLRARRFSASVAEAARLMYDRRVKRLPVANEAGQLMGIVSRVDVLSVFSRQDGDIRDEVVRRVLPGIIPAATGSVARVPNRICAQP
jgi:CBS domain-containing protein